MRKDYAIGDPAGVVLDLSVVNGCFAYELDDPPGPCLGSNLLDGDVQMALAHQGGGVNEFALFVEDSHCLSRQLVLIDKRLSFQNPSVNRDPVSRINDDHITPSDLFDWDLMTLAASFDPGDLGDGFQQVEQLAAKPERFSHGSPHRSLRDR